MEGSSAPERPNDWLLGFRSNVYSQAGEDGVLLKCVETLGDRNRWCVEFGAWDGKHLSNTRRLMEAHEYSGVLIEGDARRFKDLEASCRELGRAVPIRAFVGFHESDNLDQVLSRTEVPVDFDLLSIDIDGNDFHVWKATRRYRPKLVCIEFNPTIPLEVRFVQPAAPAVYQGSSLAALVELGQEKGYELISVLELNAVFVRRDLFPRFEIRDNRPEALWKDRSMVTHVFVGYDGTVFMEGWSRLPWHGLEIHSKDIQVLPSFLRTYPPSYSLVQRLAYWIFRFLHQPASSVRAFRRRLARNRLPGGS